MGALAGAAAVSFVATADAERVREFYVPGFEQDELAIWASPGGGRVAWFFDADGNTLSVSQPA